MIVSKTIKPSISLVKKLMEMQITHVEVDGGICSANAFFEERKLYFQHQSNVSTSFDEDDLSNKIKFKLDSFTFEVPIAFKVNHGVNMYKDEKGFFVRKEELKVKVYSYQTLNINIHSEKLYQRLVIPCLNKLSFFYKIDDIVFETEESSLRGLLIVEVEKVGFHIYIVNDDQKNSYLIIDCLKPASNKFFNEVTFSIITSLGFVTGYFVQDHEYALFYDTPNMDVPVGVKFDIVRESLKTNYQPVNSNPYSWLKNKTQDIGKYNDKLSHLTILQFERLVQLVHEKNELQAILLLIVESCSQSLLIMTPSLFVALESLRDLITDNGDKIRPLQNKNLFKRLRSEILNVIETFSVNEPLTEVEKEILKKKVDNLNTPTNNDSLRQTFSLLGITLNKREQEVLNDRNSFLHGNFYISDRGKGVSDADKKIFYTALSAYVLVSMIILKYIGFSGHLINFAKLYEESTGIYIDEDYYRLI